MNISIPVLNNTFRIRWAFVLLTGFTMFYVLYVFEGFGIQQGVSYSGHGFLYRTSMFGLMNFCVFYLLEFQLIQVVRIDSPLKKTLFVMTELAIGATAIFMLFNFFWNWTEWNSYSYALLVAEYTSVMIVPLSVKELFLFFSAKRGQVAAPPLLKFSSENGKDVIRVTPADFLYLKSAGNYIEILCLTEQGKRVELIRNTLKSLEDSLKGSPHLVRCHRSYMINPIHVKKVIRLKGRAELELMDVRVPLSPQYEENFNL